MAGKELAHGIESSKFDVRQHHRWSRSDIREDYDTSNTYFNIFWCDSYQRGHVRAPIQSDALTVASIAVYF